MRLLPDGLLRALYRVAYRLAQGWGLLGLPRGRGVKCLLTNGGELLLVRHTYGPRERWTVPGGSARSREGLAAAAAREMAEELGLRGLPWRELGVITLRSDHVISRVGVVHAELADRTLRPDSVEIAEARWFHRDDLPVGARREVRRLLAVLGDWPSGDGEPFP